MKNKAGRFGGNHKIPAGKTFDRFIEENLEDSTAVIVIWSQNSVESDWVRAEAAEGKAENVLLPVMIDNIRIPLAFRRIQTADLCSWKQGKMDENYSEFIHHVWDFFWSLAEKKGTKDAYEAYVSKFPKGPHLGEAKSRLGETPDPDDNEIVKIDPENDFWELAKKRNTIYTYKQYNKKFQNGKFADEARKRIKKTASQQHKKS